MVASVHKILVLFTYAQKPPLKSHVGLSSGARGESSYMYIRNLSMQAPNALASLPNV